MSLHHLVIDCRTKERTDEKEKEQRVNGLLAVLGSTASICFHWNEEVADTRFR